MFTAHKGKNGFRVRSLNEEKFEAYLPFELVSMNKSLSQYIQNKLESKRKGYDIVILGLHEGIPIASFLAPLKQALPKIQTSNSQNPEPLNPKGFAFVSQIRPLTLSYFGSHTFKVKSKLKDVKLGEVLYYKKKEGKDVYYGNVTAMTN